MNETAHRKLAVVTGASTGIGLEIAKRLAADDFDLVIAADSDAIDAAADELRTSGTAVTKVQVDLATPEGVERLHTAIQAIERPLDALVLNAGGGAGGAFASDTDLARELEIIDLNVRSTVHLAKLEVPAMVARGQGRVLFTSSIASTMPGTYQAVYNATKSFVQSFALALRSELDGTGVTVTSLMPGPTETRFFERAGLLDTKVGAGKKDDPAEVARMGVDAMLAGDERAVASSLKTKVQAAASRVLPDRVKAKMHKQLAEPGSAPREELAGRN